MSDISKTTINLPVDLKKELKKIAIDEDTSLSGLILKMIEEGMNSRNKSNAFSDED
ncbi:MAG: Met repressor [Methanobrevibacter sp.]|uniref:Met repressor n=1 Tax=uncultured Methanobrevibacter sp. TaxID=253161 RepID=UPI0025D9A211|nr:Met repressor [uncultured Methanobrevibacter sp.]MEE1129254.1 Met repressor [Methanobrevibacter sp.]